MSLRLIGRVVLGGLALAFATYAAMIALFSADRIELFFRGTVARPLNTVAFHLVV